MEELERGIVFRIASVKHDFPPDSPRLHEAHLVPSERDEEEARRRSRPPLLSVFDLDLCSVAQGKSIRGGPTEAVAFGFQVLEIRSLRVEATPTLRVIRDPLEGPLASLPGAAGHCGIEGLHRPPGASKLLYKQVRAELSALSFRLAEQP